MKVGIAMCALIGVAAADVKSGYELRELIAGSDRAQRQAAAAELAGRVVDQNPDLDRRQAIRRAARGDAVFAVIHDDPVVRSQLSAALVEAGVLTGEAAARIPARSVLDAQIKALLAEQRNDLGGVVPSASECRIEGADVRGLDLTCSRFGCRACEEGSAAHMPAVTTMLRVRVARRWSLISEQFEHPNRLHPSTCFCLP